jgi:hypothetical protein
MARRVRVPGRELGGRRASSRSCLKVEWRIAWYAADVSTTDPPFPGRAFAATAHPPSGPAGLEFEPVEGRVLSLGLAHFGRGSVTVLCRFSAENSVRLSLAISI